MTSRILPPEEYPRLAGTTLESIWVQLDPDSSEVIVVEEGGRILASIALVTIVHAECLTNHGGTGAMRALWRAVGERARHAGASAVWGAAADPAMQAMMNRHAQSIPGEHFLVKGSRCHRW